MNKNNCIEQIKAKIRAELISALDDVEIEHKVPVNFKAQTNQTIDYNSDKEEFSLKSARLTRKTEKGTGVTYYTLKAIVEG